MWGIKSLMKMTTGILLFGVVVLLVYQVYQWDQGDRAVRCHAAQATVLEEADLIAAAGKFPSEQVTDRWKKLLGGCNHD